MEDASDAVAEPIGFPAKKRYDPSKVRLARMSWVIPLAGLGISIFINCTAKPLDAVGFVIFAAGVVIGFVLAVLSLVLSRKYRGLTGHAIGGLVTTIAIALLIVGMFWALEKIRSIQQRQREKGPAIKQGAPP